MSIDRAALNQEREAATLLLKAEQDSIENVFTKVLRSGGHFAGRFIGIAEAKKEEEKENLKFSFHHETRGRGDTAQAALDDWKSKLRRPHGEVLYWRTEPEIDYHINFDARTAIWLVYSRYAVLKPEGWTNEGQTRGSDEKA